MLRLPLEYFLTRDPGDLTYRTRSASRLKHIASVTTIGAAFDAVLVVAYIAVVASRNIWLSLVSGFCVALFAIIIRASWTRQRELSADALEAQIAASSNSQEILSNIQTVKALGAERIARAKWFNAFSDELSAGTRKRRHEGAMSALISTLQFATPLVILLAGWVSASYSTAGLADAVTLSAVSAGLFVSLSNIAFAASTLVDMMPELSRIDDVLSAPSESAAGEFPALDIAPEVTVSDLKYTYPGEVDPVISGLNGRFGRGSFVAITGPSGAGKSTFGLLMAGLLQQQSGFIRIEGVSLDEIDRIAFRRRIGYVDQNSAVLAGSILNNIKMGNENASLEEVREAARIALIDEFIMALPMKYETLLGYGGSGISGGQRQRIALARVLVRKPSYLILDEATSAVDAESERRIFRNLKSLGMTVVAIG
ncbi:ATP-binding cassette domain-containing protein, partial [Nocardia sp. NPDC060220]|uniref:ATP-binding cassette domain-containing protein n=1 Tax=Nocardia sp. NPDC060220 TaxID=3347076 RepID=UPI003652D0B5